MDTTAINLLSIESSRYRASMIHHRVIAFINSDMPSRQTYIYIDQFVVIYNSAKFPTDLSHNPIYIFQELKFSKIASLIKNLSSFITYFSDSCITMFVSWLIIDRSFEKQRRINDKDRGYDCVVDNEGRSSRNRIEGNVGA